MRERAEKSVVEKLTLYSGEDIVSQALMAQRPHPPGDDQLEV
jgi:hypothetical protein